MVPNGWKRLKVEEFLIRVSNQVKVEANQTYREIGIRSHGKGIFHKDEITGEALGNKRVFHIEEDCFIVNIVFAWEQAVAKTTAQEMGMIASHRFPMYKPKNDQCDIDYILYLFKTKYGKHLLGLASPGGAGRNKTLGQKEFARLQLALPPLPEQREIAEILGTWDKAIDKLDQLIENSKNTKKALIQQLLTGKKRLPGFTGEWKEWHLIDAAKVIVSPVDKKIVNGEIPVELCNYTDVYYNSYITPKIDFMKATATQNEIDKYSLYVGDVIITKDSETPGDIAVPSLVRENLNGVVCGYHLAIVRSDPSIVKGAYLNFLFSMPRIRYYFYTLATGATRFGLSIGGIKKAHFKFPSIEEQQKIAEILSVQDEEIQNLEEQRKRIITEKNALMQQLLTGKKRVKVEECHG